MAVALFIPGSECSNSAVPGGIILFARRYAWIIGYMFSSPVWDEYNTYRWSTIACVDPEREKERKHIDYGRVLVQ